MNEKQRVNISRFISLILRHKPDIAGLKLDSNGWIEVSTLLKGLQKSSKPITLTQLREVVATNDKKRFEFTQDGLKIRASQGHSINIDLGISPIEPPEILYHGTAERNLVSILKQGLIKATRNHVHLSPDHDTALKVGRRHGKPIILIVSSLQMHENGFEFFLSTNGVWLTDHVPETYLQLMAPQT